MRPRSPACSSPLGLYDALAGRLPELSERWDVAFVALVVLPAAFGVAWLLLPLAGGALAALARRAGARARLQPCSTSPASGRSSTWPSSSRYVLFGFWFLELFEALVVGRRSSR